MAKLSIFQKLANKITGWKCPWLTRFLGVVQDQILIPAFLAVGEAGKDYIISVILKEAKKDISGQDKFKNVYATCRAKFNVSSIGNDFLTTLIQNIVSSLKASNLLN